VVVVGSKAVSVWPAQQGMTSERDCPVSNNGGLKAGKFLIDIPHIKHAGAPFDLSSQRRSIGGPAPIAKKNMFEIS
jgi:hypothetical protein